MIYYLCLDNIILTNSNKSLNFTFDDNIDKVKVEYIINERLYKITLNPNMTTLDDLKTWIIIKYNDDGTARRYDEGTLIKDVKELQAKTYYLYEPLKVNGFKIAMTEKGFKKSLSQYIVDKSTDIDGIFNKNLKEVTIHEDNDNICIAVPVNTSIDDYVLKVNSYNKFYIMEADEDAVLTNLVAYQTTTNNKVNIVSRNSSPIKKQHLFLDSSDYIAALINRLMNDYPEVQFYNIDKDKDENKYKEHVKYIAHLEATTGVVHNTVVFSDPVYGRVQLATVSMDFEYSCYDIPLFQKRRFDYYTGRFISDVVYNQIRIPMTDKEYDYCVVWDRATPSTDSVINKSTNMSVVNESKLSFQFHNRMIITTLRLVTQYPKILTKILNNTKYLKPNQRVPRTKKEMEVLK